MMHLFVCLFVVFCLLHEHYSIHARAVKSRIILDMYLFSGVQVKSKSLQILSLTRGHKVQWRKEKSNIFSLVLRGEREIWNSFPLFWKEKVVQKNMRKNQVHQTQNQIQTKILRWREGEMKVNLKTQSQTTCSKFTKSETAAAIATLLRVVGNFQWPT